MDFKNVLSNMVNPIVDNPDEVSISMTERDDTVILVLNVAKEDMGKVIGKHGRTARALRTVMKSAANTVNKKVMIEIR